MKHWHVDSKLHTKFSLLFDLGIGLRQCIIQLWLVGWLVGWLLAWLLACLLTYLLTTQHAYMLKPSLAALVLLHPSSPSFDQLHLPHSKSQIADLDMLASFFPTLDGGLPAVLWMTERLPFRFSVFFGLIRFVTWWLCVGLLGAVVFPAFSISEFFPAIVFARV